MNKPGMNNRSVVGISAGFSVLMFSFWAMMNIGAFHSSYLTSLGLNGVQVGVMMAVNYLMGMMSPPVFAGIADRRKDIKGLFRLSVAAIALLALALAFAKDAKILGLPLPVLIFPLLFIFYPAGYSLLDSWVIKVSNQSGNITYAQIRLFGSLGYSLVAIGASYIAGIYGLVTPYVISFLIGTFVFLWSGGRPQPLYEDVPASVSKTKGSFRQIFADRRMAMFMIYALVFNMCMTTPLTFLPWVMERIGADTALVGSIGGSKAMFEAITMVFAARLVRRENIKLTNLLVLGGILYIVNQLSYVLSGNLLHVFGVQVLEGMGYGLYLSAATQYIYNITPRELTASAQSMLVTFSFAGYIAINLIGGWMTESFGVNSVFLFNAVLQSLVTVVFVLSLRKKA